MCGLYICKLIIMRILEVVIRNASSLQFSRNSPRAHHPPCCSHWGSPSLCPRPPELQSFTMCPSDLAFDLGVIWIQLGYSSWVIFVPLCSAQTRSCQAAETKGMPCDDAVVVTQHCLRSMTEHPGGKTQSSAKCTLHPGVE